MTVVASLLRLIVQARPVLQPARRDKLHRNPCQQLMSLFWMRMRMPLFVRFLIASLLTASY